MDSKEQTLNEVIKLLVEIHKGDSDLIDSTLNTPMSAFADKSILQYIKDRPDSKDYILGTLMRIYN